jgi:hypothetical protein
MIQVDSQLLYREKRLTIPTDLEAAKVLSGRSTFSRGFPIDAYLRREDGNGFRSLAISVL